MSHQLSISIINFSLSPTGFAYQATVPKASYQIFMPINSLILADDLLQKPMQAVPPSGILVIARENCEGELGGTWYWK